MGKGYHREMSLNEWVQMFRDIYYPVQNYGRSEFEIFAHLVKAFGVGSHHLFRAKNVKESQKYLATVFAWYCALVNRMGFDLEEILWRKYPAVCPRCIKNVCDCVEPPAEIDTDKLSVAAKENEYQRPTDLRLWQIMFANLYRGPSGKTLIESPRERLALVFARIAEELGEVAEALALDQVVDPEANLIVKNEMADLGAWVFALANNLQNVDPSASGVSLADAAWQLYPGKCYRCDGLKCICIRGGPYALELAEKGAMAPSQMDERTGLANDKALNSYMNNVAREYQEGNHDWAFIFLDLDNFGQVNKTYSHEAGDEVLREAARRMMSAIGNVGKCFRRGGEEFVVVITGSHDTAYNAAEEIRLLLANNPIEIKGPTGKTEKINVTASLGVASCINDRISPDKLANVAEKREKEAKEKGKNRTVR